MYILLHLCNFGHFLWQNLLYKFAEGTLSMQREVTKNEGLFIESWSGSSGYSTEMLTEGAQSWWVGDESTWQPSVNIEVEYLELSEYDEIEWPDSPTFLL